MIHFPWVGADPGRGQAFIRGTIASAGTVSTTSHDGLLVSLFRRPYLNLNVQRSGGGGASTSRNPFDWTSLTIPAASICSIIRAARL